MKSQKKNQYASMFTPDRGKEPKNDSTAPLSLHSSDW